MIPEPLSTLLEGAEFRTAVPFGFAALVLGVAVGLLWRRSGRSSQVPLAGILVVVAGALALREQVASAPGRLIVDPVLASGLVLGLGLLLLAGVVADTMRWPLPVAALLAVPGAAVVATSTDLVDVPWIRVTVATGAVLGGWTMASLDRRWAADGLVPPLLALSAVGIYFTVPDTEEAMVLLGVAAPLAVLGWPLRLARMGTGGSLAVTGFLCWTVAAGGYGRPSSIVGGLACLGLLFVEPLGRLATGGSAWTWRRGRYAPYAAMAVHLALVYVASRVAGLRRTVPAAIGVAGAELVLATAALAVVGRTAHRTSGRRRRATQGATATDRSSP